MNQQKIIEKWFDEIYEKRGFGYLRPLDAYRIFVTLLNPKKGERHLDIACGLGLMLKAVNGRGVEKFGIDISEVAVAKARKFCPDAKIEIGNAEQLPYPDKYFDHITCIGSLERMLDRNRVLKEIMRISKENASICLMVRNAEHFTWRYILKPLNIHNKKGHQDALNLSEWKSLFVSNGFEISQIHPDHWPYYKLLKTLMPFRKIDTGRVRKLPFRLEDGYEFIFLLKKVK